MHVITASLCFGGSDSVVSTFHSIICAGFRSKTGVLWRYNDLPVRTALVSDVYEPYYLKQYTWTHGSKCLIFGLFWIFPNQVIILFITIYVHDFKKFRIIIKLLSCSVCQYVQIYCSLYLPPSTALVTHS